VVRNASIGVILTTSETEQLASGSGVPTCLIDRASPMDAFLPLPGFGQIIYTSGSTGQPKGVRHEGGQINWSAAALVAATGATANDTYLSVLPLPLLLETICAIFMPAMLGARVHFDSAFADQVARGSAQGISKTFELHQPTTGMVVPQLLRQWVGELRLVARRAPSSLRFVAVGGATVPAQIAEAAWELGIPAHEGYGLSECCSVVSLNRPGARRPDTAGRPLEGLSVSIDEGEIVVDGPSITDGYLGQEPAKRPWRTGDLGAFDEDGFLRVHGRKDSLIVTSYGRNISPEWIETMLLADHRIAFCAVVGHGKPHLTVVLFPSSIGEGWFAKLADPDLRLFVAKCCEQAPDYAVPRTCVVVSRQEAAANQLLINGRPARKKIESFVERKLATSANADIKYMSFYERLTAETAKERDAFLAIPIVQHAIRNGASHALYLDFLEQAYHHVKHTFPLLALAASTTKDERYQDALIEYMEEERGHEKWILDDIRNLGGDPETIRTGTPRIPCQVMVGYAYYAIEHVSPFAFLGSVHVLEGMSVLLADKLADAMKNALGVDTDAGFTYLRTHGSLDADHVGFFRKLVDGFDDAKTQFIIIEHAKIFYRLYGAIFHELGSRAELSNAA
jgi:long-chain acyl-CoA synthetase